MIKSTKTVFGNQIISFISLIPVLGQVPSKIVFKVSSELVICSATPPIKNVKVTSIKSKLLSALVYTGNLLEGLGLMKGFTFQAVISSPFSIDSFFVIRYEYQETRSQTCDVTLKIIH